MKSFLLCLFNLLVGVAAHASVTPQHAPLPVTAKEIAQGYRDRVIIARPKATASAEEAEQRHRVQVRRTFERLGHLRILELGDGEDALTTIARLRATGAYEFVEPDYIVSIKATPNDPGYANGSLWALNNTGQHGSIAGEPGADIEALAAWDIRREAPDVVVAVVDTGVNLQHQDIVANLWRNPRAGSDVHGANFVGGSGRMVSGDPTDDNGHGTHVAGTIGAVGNNGVGIAGVAWRVKLMAVRALGTEGRGAMSDVVAAINYAVDNGAHIINASFGSEPGDPFSQAQMTAVSRARAAGVIFVAAAGNETADLDVSRTYPASFALDNMVTVGNSDRRDHVSQGSNFGAAIDLYAPGNEIVSLAYDNNTGTTSKSGTSMAAPHVSGALALLKAQFPGDTYRQLINRLLRGTEPGERFLGRAQTGGRLNLLRALTTASNRPFNDNFADRPRFDRGNLSIRSHNGDATSEPTDPSIAGLSVGATLWWQWTPLVSGVVSVDTGGSAYDTVLGVFTGSTAGALTLVAASDNDVTGATSRLSFPAVAGTTYQIAVGGKNGATGLTILNIGTIPGNDAFAAPTLLSGESVRVNGTNLHSSRETGEPLILGFAGGNSLWFEWTAPRSGRFQASVVSTDFDPLLAIYTGDRIDALTAVSASDNTGTDNAQAAALCTFEAVAGRKYRLSLDSKNASSEGQFTLTLVDSIWQATTGESVTATPAVGQDGTVYVGSTDRVFYAFAADGSLRWSVTTGGLIDTCSAAVGPDGTVYFGSNDGKFYAVSPDGTRKWTREMVPGSTTTAAAYSPAIGADGVVYARASDGYLRALNPADGVERWRFNLRVTAANTSFYGNPVVGPDGTIYHGSDENDKQLYAINPDGTEKWRAPLDSGVYGSPALDAAGNIYLVTLAGGVYAFTPTGSPLWTRQQSGGNVSSSVALSADGRAFYYAGYDNKLYARSTSSGALLWSYPLATEVRASSPAVDSNGVIYIGCYDGQVYAVNADGSLKRVYHTGDVIRSAPVLAGTRLYVGSNDQKLYAFEIGAGPATGWSQYRANARHTGRAENDVFAIATQPQSQTVVLGAGLTLSVGASGQGPFTYQWRKDGTPLTGATHASYTVSAATTDAAGTYTVVITSPQGTLTSAAAVVTVEAPQPGRLMNVSVRTNAGSGSSTLIVGFSVSGTGLKPLLVRGVGPTLTSYAVTGVLAAPELRLIVPATNTQVAANSGWADSPALSATFDQVYAFPLLPGSKDAALVAELPAQQYTAQIAGANGTTGIALAEVYDLDPLAPAPAAKLVNVSARANVGTGGDVLIAGFVVSGNVKKKLLIRGVGPTLTGYGVAGALNDPKLEVYAGSTLQTANDDWGGSPTLSAAFEQVYAFPLPAASRDAALLVELAPGQYTAQVSGVNSTTGVALIEVYEVE